MKFLILLSFLVSCAYTEGRYKKDHHQDDFKSNMKPYDVHLMLTKKMEKCYPQSDYPVYEKTVSEFDQIKESGTISYEIDNQSMGPRPLILVEVMKDPASSLEGSLIKVYAKGDILRPGTVYSHQIHKWIDGKTVDCHSHGEI